MVLTALGKGERIGNEGAKAARNCFPFRTIEMVQWHEKNLTNSRTTDFSRGRNDKMSFLSISPPSCAAEPQPRIDFLARAV